MSPFQYASSGSQKGSEVFRRFQRVDVTSLNHGKAQISNEETQQSADGQNGGPNGGIVSLTKELFQAAITLRGSVEPADYKRYVLPIIFLRFLSLRYDRRRAELEALVADRRATTSATRRRSAILRVSSRRPSSFRKRRVGSAPR